MIQEIIPLEKVYLRFIEQDGFICLYKFSLNNFRSGRGYVQAEKLEKAERELSSLQKQNTYLKSELDKYEHKEKLILDILLDTTEETQLRADSCPCKGSS